MAYAYRIQPKRKSFLSGLSVNSIFIIVNIIAFILFNILIGTGVLSIEDIAIQPANILHGQYLWTFLTSMFMHGGYFHIFANMISLIFIGGFVERLIGRKRYFWFYMISGLVSGAFFVLLSLIFTADMNSYAVGASGALFGIAGLMMILTPNIPLYVMFIPIPIKAKYAIPGLLFALWGISISANVGIGNTAHLGGLVAGIVYGIYLRKKYKRKTAMISK